MRSFSIQTESLLKRLWLRKHWRPFVQISLISPRGSPSSKKTSQRWRRFISQKKSKMNDNCGPSRPVDNSAELARQVHQWKDLYSTECKVLKDEKMALQAAIALEVKKDC